MPPETRSQNLPPSASAIAAAIAAWDCRSRVGGHAVKYDADREAWYYLADDGSLGEPVEGTPLRQCPHCGLDPTPEGHDGCLGTIDGAKYACCGHGDPMYAYVTWGDERPGLRVDEAMDLFSRLGIGPEVTA